MKTKIAATLVALACVASIGFPAAAENASRGASLLSAMASAPAAAAETTTQTGFAVLAQLPVTALSSSEMAETRGTYLEYGGAGYVLLDDSYSAIQIPASRQPRFKAGKAIK